MSKSEKPYSESLCKNFDDPRCQAVETLWLVFSPILITIGTIGNILSICVLLRKRMRQTSASIYLTSLACADTGVLYIGLLRDWLVHLTETDYQKENNVTCKLYLWLHFVAINTSVWLLTAFTVDRQISVVWPIFARTRCSRKIRYMVVTVIPVFLIVIGSHHLFMERQVTYQWSNTTNSSYIYIIKCEPANKWYANFYYKVWSKLFFLLSSIFPGTIILTSNIMILKVILSRHKRVAPRTAVNKYSRQKRADINASVNSMLIAISVFYILSTLPASVFILLGSTIYRLDTPANVVTKTFLSTITSLLFYSNSAFNFLLYCFSGSLFRLILKEDIASLLQCFLRKVTEDRDSRRNVASVIARITTENTVINQQSQPDAN